MRTLLGRQGEGQPAHLMATILNQRISYYYKSFLIISPLDVL